MPIPNYSVCKGTPAGPGSVSGSNPHYRFSLNSGDGSSAVEVDVNVQSQDGSEILYLIDSTFFPAQAASLEALAPGLHGLSTNLQTLRLDYIRGGPAGAPLVDRSQMQLLSLTGGSGGPLNDAVASLLDQALADPSGEIYAFGSAYADPGADMGIHDIHMNQGNPPGSFERDNGLFQDGAIFIALPAKKSWSALFIAFQTQSWHTDSEGNPQ